MSTIEEEYAARSCRFLIPAALQLEAYLKGMFSQEPRIDRISCRAKDVKRFAAKAAKKRGSGELKYQHPLSEIQDQIGARVVTFYKDDVQRISSRVKQFLRPVENTQIEPENEKEFGYVGEHFILLLPTDVTSRFEIDERDEDAQFFELQIKTLFQHAWSEAEHDLGYKSPAPLNSIQRRKMAFTAAQAWGADEVFEQLRAELAEAVQH